MKHKIASIVFSYYPSDPRVRREAEALSEEGMIIDIICLRNKTEKKYENVNGVNIYRVPLRRKRSNVLRYIYEYMCFTLLCLFLLSILHIKKKYKIVHVHNMPDFLVFCSIIPRLFGTKIILDLHDPMPEVFMAKYNMKVNHVFIKLLCLQEKYSIRFSNLILTPNIAFRNLFISRGCPKSKIHIVMNSPDEKIFSQSKKCKRNNNAFWIMYHGTVVKRNGLDIALKAIAQIRQKIPNLVFQVFGDGEHLCSSRSLSVKLGLHDIVNFHGYVTLEKIAENISIVDIGIIPNEPSIHWEHALPTRIFEYLCLGRPVIVPRTEGILDYFSDGQIFFHEPGNQESLANVIFDVYKDQGKRASVLKKGIFVYKKYRWEFQRKFFVGIVENLLKT